ncbi:Rrf2 family transcriptional regulator [Enterococcus cecorum]|nr:Rrf2 family transcriptional regulator [Enterococcus cecorum]CAI3327433.1 Rrf2 family transcriptional regulator [Enterococcus cecorum]
MQISSRFTIAIHTLTCIGIFQGEHKVTSEFLARSVNVNPVIIRKVLGQLKNAELVQVQRGSGGATLVKPLVEITLLDVFNAVESIENHQLFNFHDQPNPDCPVGRNMHQVLDNRLEEIQNAMELKMKSMNLEDIVKDTQSFIEKQKNNGS